jgi:hypothetical protein
MSTYEPIASQTLGTATATVTFFSLPQNYTDLVLVMQARLDSAFTSRELRMQLNNDTGSNYSVTRMAGTGSGTPFSDRTSSQTNMAFGVIPAANQTAGNVGNAIFQIQNYSNSATNKTILNRTNDANDWVTTAVGLYRSSNPVTSITLYSTGNFVSGSTFTIYGVAQGNLSAKASGGNIVATDGTYWYHAFTSSGVFIPSSGLSADVLVVAGGGAGGAYASGGGGAGGALALSSQSLASGTPYICVVGAGGSCASPNISTNGINSVFASTTAIGGGTGGTGGGSTGTLPANGGSGGGAGSSTGYTTPGTGTAGQGNDGGTTTSGWAGGGGGAGAVGGNASSGAGGNGGAGIATLSPFGSFSSMFTLLGVGASGNIAGGGGASGGSGSGGNATAGTGGAGGGGAGGVLNTGTGATITNSTPGSPNTGGGGGGGNLGPSNQVGATGGSGLIIVRYAV